MSKNIIKIKDNFAPIFQDSSFVCNNYDLLSTLTELLSESKANEALYLLNNLPKSIAGHHPLYPYYSTAIEIRDDRFAFVSKPNSQEAIAKYPPTYKGKMIIPEKYKNFSSITELLDYSYKNQEDIDVNVKEFRKLLGDLDDPYQDDLFTHENLNKMSFKIKHREFPPAKPFKIVFGDNNYTLDYILLKVEKITDNNEVILSNKDQSIGLYISFTVNLNNNDLNFNIKVKEEWQRDVSTNLKFINFMSNAKVQNEMKLIELEENIEFMSGILNKVSFESNFGDEKKEIEFLENLKTIEDYYKEKIILPDDISDYDIENAEVLAGGIINKKVVGKFTGFSMELKITEKLKQCISESPSELTPNFYEMKEANIQIFGRSYCIGRVVRRFDKLRVVDIEKLVKKLEVLEEGDKIKIRYIPYEQEVGEYTDEFYFE